MYNRNYSTKAKSVLLVLVFVNIFFLLIIATDIIPRPLAENYDIKYYVIPIAGPYEMLGVLFKVYPCTNVSIDWSKATVSKVPFYIYGVEVEAVYIGEAMFYTNDASINHYDGGSGRIYIANNTFWFTPLIAKDGSLPPDRGKMVFRIGEPVNVVHSESAELVILYVKDFGNPKVKESLTSAGIVEGAVFNLEPMPVANYEVISTSKAGEGVIISEKNQGLNNTRVTLYIVTADDLKRRGLDKVVEGYKPIYEIFLGDTLPLSIDIFVFIIANASYMKAWRLIPISYATQPTTWTSIISLPISTTTPTSISTSITTIMQTTTTSASQQSANLSIQMLILIIVSVVIMIIAILVIIKLKVFAKVGM